MAVVGSCHVGTAEVPRVESGFMLNRLLVAAVFAFFLVTACASTQQDGVLDCEQTGDTVRGVANPALDYVGPDTPRDAAVEQQKAMHLKGGMLVENNSREFSVVVDGREVAVIHISDAPAGGFVATTTVSCPT
jgi:hypothetical protein